MKKVIKLRQSTIIDPKMLSKSTFEPLKEETQQDLQEFNKPASYPLQERSDIHDQSKEPYDSTVMGSHHPINSEADSA